MADVDSLPPVQYLILDVLAARTRLGETHWTFPSRLRPALQALAGKGLVWWKNGTAERTCQAFLTDAGREAVLMDGYAVPAQRAYEDLLASLWLYINWRFVTKQLTTEQKELFADAVDASHARANADDPDLGPYSVERWWRDG
jgi:hypothetical protein